MSLSVTSRETVSQRVEGGEVGADVIGVGDVEVGEQGAGLVPVVAGLVVNAGGVVGVAEAVVGAGLFVAVADLGGQGERGGVLGECLAGLSVVAVALAEAVEDLGFPGPVAVGAEQS